ncbi:autophagy-related protein 16-1 isoform X2 [Homalodisca vitripennis]|uniref:autophagy-related protein 16-1 isoform X2 n=1 Tax=Homalodisca vitripennis TaxID=197043 RepID=UPI001EEBA863|nr:autophagy-related protein 16-1 isoform X2 [Homalodisca vitripennis]
MNNQLFDTTLSLRNENLQLTIQNEKLRQGSQSPSIYGGSDFSKISALEHKILSQQEELTELHKRRGENAQLLIDLNNKMQEKDKKIEVADKSLLENAKLITSLRAEIELYQRSNTELKALNQVLKDEHQALQLAFTHLEAKLRKVQDENREIIDRLKQYKSKDAEKMNEENENFVRKKNAKMQKELEDAAKDMRGLSPDSFSLNNVGPVLLCASVPTKPSLKFDAHESEISAVRWSPVDHVVATGGADRRVRLWDVSKGLPESKGMLVGCNQGVMSVDFDSNCTHIICASNDFASRVWTVADQRLRHTLTGHSGKVMAAKFLGESNKVVTGSHDRTLKIWDLRSKQCTQTNFVGSSCNDLVTSDGAGTTIISGHFDKTIRFWDMRNEGSTNRIEVNGRVTSLDLSRDAKYLLSCVRDDTLRVLDLRMNQIVGTFGHDGFKVGCDWSRAVFSSEGQYVAVGSVDGSIFIWEVATQKVQQILRDNHSSPVTAVAWHPYGNLLASVDRSRRTVVWSE